MNEKCKDAIKAEALSPHPLLLCCCDHEIRFTQHSSLGELCQNVRFLLSILRYVVHNIEHINIFSLYMD